MEKDQCFWFLFDRKISREVNDILTSFTKESRTITPEPIQSPRTSNASQTLNRQSLLSFELQQEITNNLPFSLKRCSWKQLYSSLKDGLMLGFLFKTLDKFNDFVFLIQTSTDELAGFFVHNSSAFSCQQFRRSHQNSSKSHLFGNSQSFCFKVFDHSTIEVYRHSASQHPCVLSINENHCSFGGSDQFVLFLIQQWLGMLGSLQFMGIIFCLLKRF
ncbi:hypothetical protein GEMRC1_010462 [Eukaryota sp. GEM-RC1]